jgi:L-lactate utilization protein LutC
MDEKEAINIPFIKDKVISFLAVRGPSLQTGIIKELEVSSMFISAILLELINEKRIKISSMKIGSSPVYFLPGQDYLLENFAEYLIGIEREAFLKLRNEGIIFDEQLEPAYRVAMRSIKDFAIPLTYENKLLWKYFRIPNKHVQNILVERQSLWKKIFKDKPQVKEAKIQTQLSQREIGEHVWKDIEKGVKKEETTNILKLVADQIVDTNSELNQEKEEMLREAIFKQEHEKSAFAEIKELTPEELTQMEVEKLKNNQNIITKPQVKEKKKKIIKAKPENIFFTEVKAFLKTKGKDIIRIEKLDKKEMLAKVQDRRGEERPLLVAAFNKKKLSPADILKIHKKASTMDLPYYILFKGEIPKKLTETIETFKKIHSIEKIE